MNVSAQDRARKIKIILFDVDGVLTDGGIWLDSGASFEDPWQGSMASLHSENG